MICQRVTRDDIRNIGVGQIGIFTLPTQKARESGKTQVGTLKKIEGLDFEFVTMDELKKLLGNDFETIVPDESLTIAYRRLK